VVDRTEGKRGFNWQASYAKVNDSLRPIQVRKKTLEGIPHPFGEKRRINGASLVGFGIKGLEGQCPQSRRPTLEGRGLGKKAHGKGTRPEREVIGRSGLLRKKKKGD